MSICRSYRSRLRFLFGDAYSVQISFSPSLCRRTVHSLPGLFQRYRSPHQGSSFPRYSLDFTYTSLYCAFMASLAKSSSPGFTTSAFAAFWPSGDSVNAISSASIFSLVVLVSSSTSATVRPCVDIGGRTAKHTREHQPSAFPPLPSPHSQLEKKVHKSRPLLTLNWDPPRPKPPLLHSQHPPITPRHNGHNIHLGLHRKMKRPFLERP